MQQLLNSEFHSWTSGIWVFVLLHYTLLGQESYKLLVPFPFLPFSLLSPHPNLSSRTSVTWLVASCDALNLSSTVIIHPASRYLTRHRGTLGLYSAGPKPSISSPSLSVFFKLSTPTSSQIFSQPGLDLHFSCQCSVGQKNLSLGVDFRSPGVYPRPLKMHESVNHIPAKWPCLISVPSSGTFAC